MRHHRHIPSQSAQSGSIFTHSDASARVSVAESMPERDAVCQVGAPVAEREELGFEEVGAAEGGQCERRAGEHYPNPHAPSVGEDIRVLHRAVVQPVMREFDAFAAEVRGESPRSDRAASQPSNASMVGRGSMVAQLQYRYIR